jgi:hypothetical protein
MDAFMKNSTIFIIFRVQSCLIFILLGFVYD